MYGPTGCVRLLEKQFGSPLKRPPVKMVRNHNKRASAGGGSFIVARAKASTAFCPPCNTEWRRFFVRFEKWHT